MKSNIPLGLLLLCCSFLFVEIIPRTADAGIGSNPFGGRIFLKPAKIITTKKAQCQALAICGGNEGVVWADTSKASCSLGTFSLKPNLPTGSLVNNYCVIAGATNKSPQNLPLSIPNQILGLYPLTIPTQIGTCTCTNGVGPASTVTVVPVFVGMKHVRLFGTSKY